jgi:hypothetical protein
MGRYYKATNMYGKDFYSNTVQFTVGESVPPLPEVIDPRCCSSDVYHASTHPESTLIGGAWPCRLFEVEGEPVADEDHKRGFYTFKVVREIEAWRALGPNGRELVALIERCQRLTADEAGSLAAARATVPDSAWDAAWNVVWDTAWNTGRATVRDVAWEAAWAVVRAAAVAAGNAAGAAVGDAIRNAAWNVVRSAIVALCLRDVIAEEHFNTLYGPWASVIDSQ